MCKELRYELNFKKSNLSRKACNTQLKRFKDCDKEYERLREIKLNIKEFVSNSNNLLIYSKYTGNGKTTWASKIGDAYIKETVGEDVKDDKYTDGTALIGYRQKPVFFINVPQLLALKKASFNSYDTVEKIRGYEDAIKNSDLVIWDEIATYGMTDYEQSYICELLECRLMKENNAANIFTYGNKIAPEECQSILGDRLRSRILTSEIVKLEIGDIRCLQGGNK